MTCAIVPGRPRRRIQKDVRQLRRLRLLLRRFSVTLPPMPATLQAFIAILFWCVLRSFRLLGKPHAERLASLVFSISLPATIVVSLDHVAFTPSAWKLPVSACLITLAMLLCTWLLARICSTCPRSARGFLLGTGCINSVYFAYPVVLATFGGARTGARDPVRPWSNHLTLHRPLCHRRLARGQERDRSIGVHAICLPATPVGTGCQSLLFAGGVASSVLAYARF